MKLEYDIPMPSSAPKPVQAKPFVRYLCTDGPLSGVGLITDMDRVLVEDGAYEIVKGKAVWKG